MPTNAVPNSSLPCSQGVWDFSCHAGIVTEAAIAASAAGRRWQGGDRPPALAIRNLLFVSLHLAEQGRRVDIERDYIHQIL